MNINHLFINGMLTINVTCIWLKTTSDYRKVLSNYKPPSLEEWLRAHQKDSQRAGDDYGRENHGRSRALQQCELMITCSICTTSTAAVCGILLIARCCF